MVIHVYWEGMERDRAYVEASYASKSEKKNGGRRGGGSSGGGKCGSANDSRQERCMRLSVRVPTLAVVDAQAATKVAERLAQQVVIEVDEEGATGGSGQSVTTLLRL